MLRADSETPRWLRPRRGSPRCRCRGVAAAVSLWTTSTSRSLRSRGGGGGEAGSLWAAGTARVAGELPGGAVAEPAADCRHGRLVGGGVKPRLRALLRARHV